MHSWKDRPYIDIHSFRLDSMKIISMFQLFMARYPLPERSESKLFVSIVRMIGIASFSRHFHIIKVWFVPKAIEKLPLTRGI